jgi:type I restriction enzyme M protein
MDKGIVEDKFAFIASFEEIKENDFNLNIPRYVDTFEPEPEIDIKAVMDEIKSLEAKRDELDKEIKVYLKELGIDF